MGRKHWHVFMNAVCATKYHPCSLICQAERRASSGQFPRSEHLHDKDERGGHSSLFQSTAPSLAHLQKSGRKISETSFVSLPLGKSLGTSFWRLCLADEEGLLDGRAAIQGDQGRPGLTRTSWNSATTNAKFCAWYGLVSGWTHPAWTQLCCTNPLVKAGDWLTAAARCLPGGHLGDGAGLFAAVHGRRMRKKSRRKSKQEVPTGNKEKLPTKS